MLIRPVTSRAGDARLAIAAADVIQSAGKVL
jgi:hypothetical protein